MFNSVFNINPGFFDVASDDTTLGHVRLTSQVLGKVL
jgi:hypothetical protein